MADDLLPETPRLSGFDAKSFSTRLHERVLSATGARYVVFDPEDDAGQPLNLVKWKKSADALRDHLGKVTRFANDLKLNLDRHGVTLGAHDRRLDKAEADIALLKANDPPFPIA